ncbi:MAG: hypothetical protein K2H82_03515 [Oscillospiraceae bacterium]|nr:hypothetical protein [Oscillospiraceae bacterium]
MKTLTFIIVLVMELFYATMLISFYMGEKWFWLAFLLAAVVCGISVLFVWIYCWVRRIADIRAVMKSGTTLVFGIETGALLLYYIVTHWRWLM